MPNVAMFFGIGPKKAKQRDKQKVDGCLLICGNGASGEIRTPDHLVRSQVLYPTELRTRMRNSTRVCYFEWRAVTTV